MSNMRNKPTKDLKKDGHQQQKIKSDKSTLLYITLIRNIRRKNRFKSIFHKKTGSS